MADKISNVLTSSDKNLCFSEYFYNHEDAQAMQPFTVYPTPTIAPYTMNPTTLGVTPPYETVHVRCAGRNHFERLEPPSSH